MTQITVQRTIDAPLGTVFRAVTEVENLPASIPDVVSVEFLSEARSGVGTRFRETRRMGKREMQTELEVTELVPNERARMVADSHGTVWDTLFTVRPAGDKTELEICMDARPHKLLPRLMNPLMKGVFRGGLQKHLDAVSAYCEAQGR